MSKVYILVEWMAYEYENMKQAFATREDAEKAYSEKRPDMNMKDCGWSIVEMGVWPDTGVETIATKAGTE